ncbi:hypothetical protein [Mucilaginibacter ginsenosidivorans]|uniref:Uncharacterized protein n=1 Tax=Mucilaginibacter ginsenosidivorans TaxID=398053 RepID=A0A5B8UWS3_9SPHI|nr:hypothetical protein [Mucilaginibacter ginsenosidivorans]QEC63382.1 hypothetical protein FRZ54_12615 [Mucilaginibacter ginsenosidivorans]
MKKFLYVLFAAAIFAGCKKDISTVVNITPADLSHINAQLKGIWLFPIESQKIVDTTGKALAPLQYVASPALQFDGFSHVTIFQDIQTKVEGTYTLSTTNGFVYLDVTEPDGTDVNYQVLFADGQTLKLVVSQPYIYYTNSTPVSAQSISNILLKKQTGADVNGNIVRVVVKSDSSVTYSVIIAVRHAALAAPADTSIILSNRADMKGTFTYEFVGKEGDELSIDVGGDYTKTSFYAFYNGIPMAGNIGYDYQEIKTTTGWRVP